ncbi:Sterol-4-alpha-carboxylate 3-dehydrogenase,decarboxylating [Lachnellula hyalina]|uniref:Sterol-4-alpha-carboxylate 3-dehydrogenase ERG26, decarboxylating n=1 Tax=Lachnellula hyalina TaxID=1316788 RepID=A0A8H8R726_9HELO|nr:Sterol-4-alpha-carboxylate 3-dehydrogenase,decarboxylating [Lachnellula hyalina]TVY29759.1 Sterol-4-alpha-carboxylate 3-dehydrogenase,decarboxylating [Lachnellula hyalina]
MAPPAKKNLGNVLVIGGCGFLGHHIVNLLHDTYTSKISVLDLSTTRNRRPDSDGVAYYNGDITSISSLVPIFEKAKPDVVIHTASPTLMGAGHELYRKVNVDGTACVIEACQKTGVKALVYTSSASVIHDTISDLKNADERWPVVPPHAQHEYYSQTKAEAEALVLAANRSPTLLTCSIRPAGIFGEGDVQILPPILNVHYTNRTGFQLGDNTNLFDFTYVVNVAHAHLLAAFGLLATSRASTAILDHEKVDGEAFFITNCSPVYFWDFARAVWAHAGSKKGTEHVWVISRDMGLAIGGLLEWITWAVGRQAKLTKRQVKYSTMTRYYDCGKAQKRLGYQPLVGLNEGLRRGVKWFEEQRTKEGEKKDQ